MAKAYGTFLGSVALRLTGGLYTEAKLTESRDHLQLLYGYKDTSPITQTGALWGTNNTPATVTLPVAQGITPIIHGCLVTIFGTIEQVSGAAGTLEVRVEVAHSNSVPFYTLTEATTSLQFAGGPTAAQAVCVQLRTPAPYLRVHLTSTATGTPEFEVTLFYGMHH